MEKGSPAADLAALPLFALTVLRPVGHAIAIGWPLPAFASPGEPCLLAIHQGRTYHFGLAARIERETGHQMPSQGRAPVGVVAVGRFDGARVLDVQPIPAVFAKGSPGLWRLDAAGEAQVRERYAAAMEKARRAPVTATLDWSNQ